VGKGKKRGTIEGEGSRQIRGKGANIRHSGKAGPWLASKRKKRSRAAKGYLTTTVEDERKQGERSAKKVKLPRPLQRWSMNGRIGKGSRKVSAWGMWEPFNDGKNKKGHAGQCVPQGRKKVRDKVNLERIDADNGPLAFFTGERKKKERTEVQEKKTPARKKRGTRRCNS